MHVSMMNVTHGVVVPRQRLAPEQHIIFVVEGYQKFSFADIAKNSEIAKKITLTLFCGQTNIPHRWNRKCRAKGNSPANEVERLTAVRRQIQAPVGIGDAGICPAPQPAFREERNHAHTHPEA
jgi:hypothetical protein